PRPVGQELDDPGGEAACDTQGHRELSSAQPQRRGHARGGAEGADNAHGMEVRFVNRARRDVVEAADGLQANDEALEAIRARPVEALAGGEDGRDDHGADASRRPFERVIEVLAMRGGAVYERGPRRVQRTGVTESGALSDAVPAGEERGDVLAPS